MINFGKSRIWFSKSDISSLILLTFFILVEMRGIWPIKYWVCNNVLEILLIKKDILVF